MNPMEQNMLEAQKMQAQGMKQRIIAEHLSTPVIKCRKKPVNKCRKEA
jgi:hypothetical protein